MDQSASGDASSVEEIVVEPLVKTIVPAVVQVRKPTEVRVAPNVTITELDTKKQLENLKEEVFEKGTQASDGELDDSLAGADYTINDESMDVTRDEEDIEGVEAYEDDDDDLLFPFICGICDYRFNRIDVYYQHFQTHTDIVTEEYFHPCMEEEGEVKIVPAADHATKNVFKCGSCDVEFPTLCLLHDHLSRTKTNKLYIVDMEENKATPRSGQCVGTVLNGAADITYKENAAVSKKREVEEVYDDAVEPTAEAGSQTKERELEAEQCVEIDTDTSDKNAGIQRITVNYGNKKETYLVQKNEDGDDVGIMGSESEADMDMSDYEDHNYNDTPVKKRKGWKTMDSKDGNSDFFGEYEGEKIRGKLIKFNSPQEMKDLVDSAKYAEGHGDDTRVFCPVCDKVVNQLYLIKHIKKCHADERVSCDICGKTFANGHYLKDHRRFVHEGYKRGKGKMENGTYQSPRQLKYEGLKLHGEECGANTKVYCPQCDKVVLRSYLPKHIQKVHAEKNVECELCGRLFTNKGYLADHKRYMHEGRKKRSVMLKTKPKSERENDEEQKLKVKCPKCPKVILAEYLSKHIQQAHSDEEYPCDACGKVFTCQRFLNDHKRCVHTEYDTQCEICMKMFKGKSAKEKHKKMVHSDALPYECGECTRRFRSHVEYSRHMTVHKDIGVYCFQCPRCERRFKSQKAMNYHDRSVHKRIGRLQCKWPGCGRILNDRASFKKHYLIHTGDRPNKCPHCERAFIQRVALKYHLRREHNVFELPPGQTPTHRRESQELKMEPEDHAVPVPLYVQDEEGNEEYSEMEVVQAISDAATVDISDSAIVSDLIQIAQSSEGAVVPEALQHVFDGNNKTIVIYYQ